MRIKYLWAVCSLLSVGTQAVSNDTSKQSQQILQSDFKPPPVFENVNLIRTTNLEKGYVRETINVVIQNVDSKPQSQYYLPFTYDAIGKIGGFEVRDKKDATRSSFQVTLAPMAAVAGDDGTTTR